MPGGSRPAPPEEMGQRRKPRPRDTEIRKGAVPPAVASGPRGRLVPYGPVLLVVLATAIAYAPVLQNGFVDFDDQTNLVENPYFRGFSAETLRWMLTNLDGHYLPLTWLSFAFDYSLWGMNPAGYHLTSLLLHLANTVVFAGVSTRLYRLAFGIRAGEEPRALVVAAAMSAALFALHPLRVESVAWATERRDVLSGLFILLTVRAYLDAHTGDRQGVAWKALGLYLLSLLAKPVGMSLPARARRPRRLSAPPPAGAGARLVGRGGAPRVAREDSLPGARARRRRRRGDRREQRRHLLFTRAARAPGPHRTGVLRPRLLSLEDGAAGWPLAALPVAGGMEVRARRRARRDGVRRRDHDRVAAATPALAMGPGGVGGIRGVPRARGRTRASGTTHRRRPLQLSRDARVGRGRRWRAVRARAGGSGRPRRPRALRRDGRYRCDGRARARCPDVAAGGRVARLGDALASRGRRRSAVLHLPGQPRKRAAARRAQRRGGAALRGGGVHPARRRRRARQPRHQRAQGGAWRRGTPPLRGGDRSRPRARRRACQPGAPAHRRRPPRGSDAASPDRAQTRPDDGRGAHQPRYRAHGTRRSRWSGARARAGAADPTRLRDRPQQSRDPRAPP